MTYQNTPLAHDHSKMNAGGPLRPKYLFAGGANERKQMLQDLVFNFHDDNIPLAWKGYAVAQVPDDTIPNGQAGYSTGIQLITQSNGRIATITADVDQAENHNHLGFYTAVNDPELDGDAQPGKRLNIQGGQQASEFDFYDTSIMNIRGNSFDAADDLLVNLRAVPTQDAALRFQENSDVQAVILHDSSRNALRFQHYDNANIDMLEMDAETGFDFHGQPVHGMRDIPNATLPDLTAGERATDSANGRFVWKDATGSGYYVSGTSL